jgi:phosphatidylinositol alpha-1,6-mannosyltransferase
MPKVLIVTNDFPPRIGGIQSFVQALALRLPPERQRATSRREA